MNTVVSKQFLRIAVQILKLALTGFIIWSIFRKMDFGQVLSSLVSLPVWLLLSLLLLSLLRHWGQFLTWGYALQINPLYKVNWKEVFNSYIISQPLRFAIPGGLGMTGKILYITNSSLLATGLSYGIERFLIIWGIWVFAIVSGAFYFTRIQLWARLLVVVVALSVPLLGYFVLGAREKWRHLQEHYRTYAPRIIGVQLLVALTAYLQYWLLLKRVAPIGFGDTLMRMSLTQLSVSIPITWAGLGLRETFAIHFLSEAGFQAIQAVTATLTMFIIQDVLAALMGSIFFLRVKKISGIGKHGRD